MAENTDSKTSKVGGVGPWGPNQSWAVVWFFAVILLGTSMTFLFSSIDFYMYTNNAQVLDFQKYGENRRAFSSMSNDSLDPRSNGSLTAAQ
jgi:hypothetical protein